MDPYSTSIPDPYSRTIPPSDVSDQCSRTIPPSEPEQIKPLPPGPEPRMADAKPKKKNDFGFRFVVYAVIICQVAMGFAIYSTRSESADFSNASLRAYKGVLSDLRTKSIVPNSKFAQIPEGLADFSVRLRVQDGNNGRGTGSGVLVSSTHIVTNYHVVQSAMHTKTVWIDFPNQDGTVTSVVGVIDVLDAARDLAFVKLPVPAKRWATLSKAQPRSYSPIIAIACPNGRLPLATSGYFGRKTSDGRYEMSISAFWGSSGGPVYDPHTGELICLFNEMDRPHISADNRVPVYPTSIFMGIPSTWVLEVMKANNINNDQEHDQKDFPNPDKKEPK